MVRAVLCMCGTAVAFAALTAIAKHLGRDYPVAQVVWARTAGHLVFVLLAFGPRRGRQLFTTQHLPSQLARSMLLLGATALNFTALQHVELATATALTFTSPLIVVLLAAPLLGERVRASRWAAVAIGFLGTLVIVQPGRDVARLASLLVIGTATCWALYQILTRRVADVDPPETTASYSALAGTLVMSLAVPFAWAAPRSPGDIGLAAAMGLAGGLGHYLVARAYMWAPASLVSPLNYLQLVTAAAAGYLAFGDVPGASLWAGAALITGAGLLVTYPEARRQTTRAQPWSPPPRWGRGSR